MSFDGDTARFAAAEVAPDCFVVRASGLVDDHAASELRNALFPIAAADGAHVLLDLGDAIRIDRASLHVIASAARLSRRRGDDLAVITRDPTLSTRLAASGADGLVRFHDSVKGWFAR